MKKMYGILLVISGIISGCASPIESKGLIVMDVPAGYYSNLNEKVLNFTDSCFEMSINKINFSEDWFPQVSFRYEDESGNIKTQVSITREYSDRNNLILELIEWEYGKKINTRVLKDDIDLSESVFVGVNFSSSNEMKIFFENETINLSSEYTPSKAVYNVSSSKSKIEFYDIDSLCN